MYRVVRKQRPQIKDKKKSIVMMACYYYYMNLKSI